MRRRARHVAINHLSTIDAHVKGLAMVMAARAQGSVENKTSGQGCDERQPRYGPLGIVRTLVRDGAAAALGKSGGSSGGGSGSDGSGGGGSGDELRVWAQVARITGDGGGGGGGGVSTSAKVEVNDAVCLPPHRRQSALAARVIASESSTRGGSGSRQAKEGLGEGLG